jgi:hypothetical protein
VQSAEHPGTTLNPRFDLEVLFPHRSITKMLRHAGDEEVGGLEKVPIA